MEKVIPKFVRIIKDLNSQSDLEKEEQNWRHDTLGFQTKLQIYSNQNSITLG